MLEALQEKVALRGEWQRGQLAADEEQGEAWEEGEDSVEEQVQVMQLAHSTCLTGCHSELQECLFAVEAALCH